jgi:hypothetical protein
MVNEQMVNAETSCLIHADFCVFFPVSGRFLRFKNPVKYTSNFRINYIGRFRNAAKTRQSGAIYHSIQWVTPKSLPFTKL